MPTTTRPRAKKRLLAALVFFALPVLTSVGICLILYHHRARDGSQPKTGAFNTRLPAPNLKKTEKNKLELYLDAEKDSLRREQALQSDPYARIIRPVPTPPIDTNERNVNAHLARLYAVLHTNPAMPASGTDPQPASPLLDREPDHLQQLETRLHQPDTTPNPQLQQVNTLLDKVLAIQHPERHNPAPTDHQSPGPVYPVSTRTPDTGGTTPEDANGFYGLTKDEDSATPTLIAIRAVVHADQTVQTGSIVKLRLLQDIYLKGIRIPAGSFLFGPCAVGNERVTIRLSRIQYNGNVYPIDLTVLDGADGLEGLYVPGAITRDVLKEGTAQSVSSLGLNSIDPSLGAQAAAAGIETAKNLLSRKIRLITATLKAGQLAILQPGQTH